MHATAQGADLEPAPGSAEKGLESPQHRGVMAMARCREAEGHSYTVGTLCPSALIQKPQQCSPMPPLWDSYKGPAVQAMLWADTNHFTVSEGLVHSM